VIDAASLKARLDDVRARLVHAAGRARRDPATIRLVAVSKTFGVDAIREIAGSGQLDFGENRIQEALPKIDATRDLPLRWHLIGHLQSNKARKAVDQFAVIHSIDSVTLLERVNRAAGEAGRTVDVLIQVDLAGEATKHGLPAGDVPAAVESALACESARLVGLMLLPPWHDDPETTRPYFARLRSLRDDLVARGTPAAALRELSMGMSHDFEVAIEEGATIVRVGTAIFGERHGL
jgi:pyridoxal phosphate enzyme (YggS family)